MANITLETTPVQSDQFPLLPLKPLLRQSAPWLLLSGVTGVLGGFYAGNLYARMMAYKWPVYVGAAVLLYGAYRYGKSIGSGQGLPERVTTEIDKKRQLASDMLQALSKAVPKQKPAEPALDVSITESSDGLSDSDGGYDR